MIHHSFFLKRAMQQRILVAWKLRHGPLKKIGHWPNRLESLTQGSRVGFEEKVKIYFIDFQGGILCVSRQLKMNEVT